LGKIWATEKFGQPFGFNARQRGTPPERNEATMGFYSKIVLPRLIDLAMRNAQLSSYRQKTVGAARGLVLEIGVGSGMNLPLYGSAVDRVCGIDPAPELLDRARERIAAARVPVSLIRASAEQLPFRDAAFDTLVMTWTLCSIPNPGAALNEMRRVMKPGGCLLFVEHGLSQEPRIIRWQHRLTPCWRHIGGGCHLDRKMDDLIRAAGFRMDALETGYMKGPKPWTFMYRGRAQL
jgi:SAM-dependent methyltransferase